ncbi:unnamed protein product [Cuscuta epithymum]|uniref:Uncharacterized protein n=1 Tax=Cuscuta epithymum TaxID=186058 RepID=A0AAV0D8N6_9ASTE|nr:unnamed protein product [Cuscuta epithymum]
MDDSGNVRLRQHGATTATWFHSGDVVRLRRSGANPFSDVCGALVKQGLVKQIDLKSEMCGAG